MIPVQERTQYWRRVKTRVCCWSSRRSCTCFKRVLVACQMISLTKWHDESTWPFCRREQDSRGALVWLWLGAKYPLRMIWFEELLWRQTIHCKHSHATSSSHKWCLRIAECVSTGKEDDAVLSSVNNWYTTKTLLSVVCLFTKNEEKLCNELTVTKAMNCVCEKAGDRFVYSYVARKAYDQTDIIYDHWNSIQTQNARTVTIGQSSTWNRFHAVSKEATYRSNECVLAARVCICR